MIVGGTDTYEYVCVKTHFDGAHDAHGRRCSLRVADAVLFIASRKTNFAITPSRWHGTRIHLSVEYAGSNFAGYILPKIAGRLRNIGPMWRRDMDYGHVHAVLRISTPCTRACKRQGLGALPLAAVCVRRRSHILVVVVFWPSVEHL